MTCTVSLSPRLPVSQFIFSKHVDYSVEINETSSHTKQAWFHVNRAAKQILLSRQILFLLPRLCKRGFAGLSHATRILHKCDQLQNKLSLRGTVQKMFRHCLCWEKVVGLLWQAYDEFCTTDQGGWKEEGSRMERKRLFYSTLKKPHIPMHTYTRTYMCVYICV